MKIIRPITITDATLTASDVPENDHPAWSAPTTYALGDEVIIAATHRAYRSLQAANLNKAPATETTWWLDIGATNRWVMFDSLVNSTTSQADSIAVTLTPTERSDSVVLLNVSAATVSVSVTDVTDGVVFAETYNMVSASGIQDWYDYFFEPVVRKTELYASGLPPYANAAIAITITGATAAVGECIVGLSREIGGTQYGAKIGIRDYSIKEQDAFGNYSILERTFSRRGTFTVWADSNLTTEIQNILAGYRATPVVYIGSDSIDATIIYGFYKDFDIDIAFPDVSICSLDIEGLT